MPLSYVLEMIGHAEQCVERYRELANCKQEQLKQVATPCIDDHNFSTEDFTQKGVLSSQAARIVLKCLYLALHGRPDILWSVNSLAREVTRWTVACDQRLWRLISYIRSTTDWGLTSIIGNKAGECKIALYVDSNFAGDLKDSKSTSGCFMALVGSNTFAPISWFCKKQTAVSHSSSEAEVIALDAGMRMEGIPLVVLWEQILDVLYPTTQIPKQPRRPMLTSEEAITHTLQKVDFVPYVLPKPAGRAKLQILEDNEAVIKMTLKRRSPALRHVVRTHRVDLDWLFELIDGDPSIFIRHVKTQDQIADFLNKGQFTAQQFSHICRLAQVGQLNSSSHKIVMANRSSKPVELTQPKPQK